MAATARCCSSRPRRRRCSAPRSSELHGHRLFDRVHVADRPAYLTALADAAALGEARSVEFRVRRDRAGARCAGGRARRRNSSGSRCAAAGSTRAGERCRRARGGRGDARRHRAQDAGAGARAARAEADQANAAKVQVPRQHEPRAAHAAQRHHRLLRHADERGADAARRRAPPANTPSSSTIPARICSSVVNGILDMSKMETGDFEISPEPFAPAQVIGNCCDHPGAQGARVRPRSDDAAAGRSAGDHRPTSARSSRSCSTCSPTP